MIKFILWLGFTTMLILGAMTLSAHNGGCSISWELSQGGAITLTTLGALFNVGALLFLIDAA